MENLLLQYVNSRTCIVRLGFGVNRALIVVVGLLRMHNMYGCNLSGHLQLGR